MGEPPFAWNDCGGYTTHGPRGPFYALGGGVGERSRGAWVKPGSSGGIVSLTGRHVKKIPCARRRDKHAPDRKRTKGGSDFLAFDVGER